MHNLTHTGGQMKKQNFILTTLAQCMVLGRMGDLELKYSSESDIPAGFESLYTEKDGEWKLTGVKGMQTTENVQRLESALNKERNDHKVTKEKYAPLAGKDINEIITTLDRIPELEAAASGAGNDPKKIDELVEAKIKTRLSPIERERDQLKAKNAELETSNNALNGQITGDKIRSELTRAAVAAKIIPGAMDDVLMYGERLFTLDESGKIVTKDGVGVTPGLDPSVWLTDTLEKKTHWLPPTHGGGAQGGKGGGQVGNPFSHDGWNMTEQMRIARENPAKAEQLAKIVGVDIKNPQKPQAPSK